jgi:hypothetical protein
MKGKKKTVEELHTIEEWVRQGNYYYMRAFKDGVLDGLVRGRFNQETHDKYNEDLVPKGEYYKEGYDYGLVLYEEERESKEWIETRGEYVACTECGKRYTEDQIRNSDIFPDEDNICMVCKNKTTVPNEKGKLITKKAKEQVYGKTGSKDWFDL